MMNIMSTLPMPAIHHLHKCSALAPLPGNLNLKHRMKQVLCCSETHNLPTYELSRNGRRQVMCHVLSLFSALPSLVPAGGAEEIEPGEQYKLYEDKTDKFSLLIPQDWVKGEGKADGQRTVTAFFPENGAVSNVNVIITGVGADYTKMESFGTVDAFGETLVNTLDRSWQRPPGQAAKLLDTKSKNGMYYVEYSLQKPGESRRHLLSAIGMAFNGWYNRLYTVTGQYLEEDTEKYRSKIEKSISSFRIF